VMRRLGYTDATIGDLAAQGVVGLDPGWRPQAGAPKAGAR